MSDIDLLVICAIALSDAEAQTLTKAVEHLELAAKGLEVPVLTRAEAHLPERGQGRRDSRPDEGGTSVPPSGPLLDDRAIERRRRGLTQSPRATRLLAHPRRDAA